MQTEQNAKTIFNIDKVSESSFNFLAETSTKFMSVSGEEWKDVPSPTIAKQLLTSHISKQSLLVLRSEFVFDKVSLLQSLAYSLTRDQSLPIKEWVGNDEHDSLFQAIRNESESCVLVINRLSPQDINYDIGKLQREIENRQIILLASSDDPGQSWYADTHLASVFFTLNETNVTFSKDEISRYWKLKLGQIVEKIEFAPDTLDHLEKEIELHDFIYPEQVDRLVTQLKASQEVIGISEVDHMLSRASKEKLFDWSSWFAPFKRADKLTILGMTLLSGLTEDQFFAAMVQFGEKWGSGDEGLPLLDYEDIYQFFDVFKFETISTADGEYNILSSRYSNLQSEIIDIIWNSHRRHLISAIPILYELIKHSIENKYSERELYGTRSKRQRLRRVLGETISLIGSKSIEMAEPILLQLASHRDLGIQSVAAKAMANWRSPSIQKSEAPPLFELLKQWQNQAKYLQYIQYFLSDDEKNNSEAANSFLKATIILTLGRAAQFDPPNAINQELLDILLPFTNDKNPLVRSRTSDSLRFIIKSNGMYMTDQQWGRIINHLDFIESSAIGLAWAWRDDPDALDTFIYNKIQKLLIEADDLVLVKGYSSSDRWSALIILYLGFLIKQEGIEVRIKDKRVADWLWELRSSLKNPGIKELAWQMHMIFGALPNKRYDEIERAISSLSVEEENMLLQGLGLQYVEERKNLRGGDAKTRRDGELYSLWMDSQRPEVEVEQLLYQWLYAIGTNEDSHDEGTRQMLQQVAFMGFQELARVFDHWEDKVIEAKLEEREKELQRREEETIQYEYEKVESAMIPLNEGWLGKLYNHLFGSKKSQLIKGLKNILKHSPKVDVSLMRLVVNKWKEKDDEELKKIAKSLEKELNKQIA